MSRYLLIAIAGGLGALARYEVSLRVQTEFSSDFPIGTLAVNVLGCFLFGLIWSMSEERMLLSVEARTILLSGFMGAFTTFSTFGFETSTFLRLGQWTSAFQNIALQLILGLSAVLLGGAIGRRI